MEEQRNPGKLRQIPVGKIRPNPDNPRLTFRQAELDELQESIRQYGVQVPIAVYRDGDEFVLIDGERRWRCASKLNHREIPALVQEKPSPLENLLLMFNIHSLREQWDLLTVSMKLPSVMTLLEDKTGRPPTEADLSAATGLPRGVIRRCKLLLDLPPRYREMLLAELAKPKSRQRLSEDLFIEMERALTTVQRSLPDIGIGRDEARESLLAKYKAGTIRNIVDLRKVAKIARADKVGGDHQKAVDAVERLVRDPSYKIEQAFADTVSGAYAERDIVSRIESLLSRLGEVNEDDLDEDVRSKLQELVRRAQQVLGEQE